MGQAGTIQSFLGLASGVVALVLYLVGGAGVCGGESVCSSTQSLTMELAAGGGLLLAVVSVASLIGPRILLFVGVGISGLLAAALLLVGVEVGLPLLWQADLVILVATVLVGMLAIVRKSEVSEQSNPMNLPVFG